MKPKGICQKKFCRAKTKGTKLCDRHRRAEWVEKNKIRDRYNHLKGNAKRRGIPFVLTYEEFEKFCTSTGYITKVGRQKNSATIDRVIPKLGYRYGNLQVLTNRMNAMKWNLHDKHIKDIDPELIKQREQEEIEHPEFVNPFMGGGGYF